MVMIDLTTTTTVYVVEMHRWGDKKGHSYVHAVHIDRLVAYQMGELERIRRDSKYEYVVHELPLTTWNPSWDGHSFVEASRIRQKAAINSYMAKTSLEPEEAFILPKHYVLRFDDIEAPRPPVARLKRSKKTKARDMKRGKSNHYKKKGRDGYEPRKDAKKTKRERK